MGRIRRVLKPAISVFEQLWIGVWSKLDGGFKRMCVMASLHAVLMQCRDNEGKKISQLNGELHLVRDEAALRLPTLFGPYVWNGLVPIEKVDLQSDRYFERIARKTPCWLWYTDEANFIAELKALYLYCARERHLCG